VMKQPIQDCSGDYIVVKNMPPLIRVFIGGNDD
jgi:hypothetical protein